MTTHQRSTILEDYSAAHIWTVAEKCSCGTWKRSSMSKVSYRSAMISNHRKWMRHIRQYARMFGGEHKAIFKDGNYELWQDGRKISSTVTGARIY